MLVGLFRPPGRGIVVVCPVTVLCACACVQATEVCGVSLSGFGAFTGFQVLSVMLPGGWKRISCAHCVAFMNGRLFEQGRITRIVCHMNGEGGKGQRRVCVCLSAVCAGCRCLSANESAQAVRTLPVTSHQPPATVSTIRAPFACSPARLRCSSEDCEGELTIQAAEAYLAQCIVFSHATAGRAVPQAFAHFLHRRQWWRTPRPTLHSVPLQGGPGPGPVGGQRPPTRRGAFDMAWDDTHEATVLTFTIHLFAHPVQSFPIAKVRAPRCGSSAIA